MGTEHKDRMTVLRGVFVAWITMLFYGALVIPHVSESRVQPELGLATALCCAALPLLLGVAAAARMRHFEQDIDGGKPAPGSALDITLRFINNTTEQSVLFALAATTFYLVAPLEAGLLQAVGLWHLVARAAFYIGYRRTPLARAAGFAATFHATVLLWIYSGALLIGKLA